MNFEISENSQGTFSCVIDESFSFERGGEIRPLKLVYETYGKLSAKKDNVIVIHHGLSPSQHVHSHAKNTTPGWWEGMIGPGRALDTDRYFIICINNLGSSFGSSSPLNGRLNFPVFTMRDVAQSQLRLLQCLGISKVFAMIGNSMGGMISLAWAIEFPETVEKILLISSCYKAYPANIANRTVQREIILMDPEYQNGNYTSLPLPGLVLARKLGHFTYRNPDDLNRKFADNVKTDPEVPCDVENYLTYNATKFAEQFDPNCYLYFLTAMDLFDVTRGYSEKSKAFSRIQATAWVVSVDSDILFTPQQQLELYHELQSAGSQCELIQHHSPYGHDAFLVEVEEYGKLIRKFLGH